MSLATRLRALERDGDGNACPACGWPQHGWPLGARLVVTEPAVFERLERVPVTEQPGDRCGKCGRLLVVRIASPGVAAAP